ncbi:hypothetical protein [Streptomyces sp. enrichment culture]
MPYVPFGAGTRQSAVIAALGSAVRDHLQQTEATARRVGRV